MKTTKLIYWTGRMMMVFGVLGVLNMIRIGIDVSRPGWYGGPLLATLLLGPGLVMWYFTKDKIPPVQPQKATRKEIKIAVVILIVAAVFMLAMIALAASL